VAPETSAPDEGHLLLITRKKPIMPTYNLYIPRTYSTWHPDRRTAANPVAVGWIRVAMWVDRARQRRALATLDDQMLRDIGVTRVEVARECDKPFWR
jgi:uncharacterized protein YjiS (DUF1127 family)